MIHIIMLVWPALLAAIMIAGVSVASRPSKGKVALLTRLGGLIVVLAGLLFAALHWRPHG